MNRKSCKRESGFSFVELTIVLLLVGIAATFAAPKITNAMRQHRLNMAMRQVADLVQKGKAEALSENRKASLLVDRINHKIGLVVYDENSNALRIDFVTLPAGVDFAQPANNSAPIMGAPTDLPVSFPAQNKSTNMLQQDFTSRGFLSVATPGTINALYFGSGADYRAVTITSVGGVRTFVWKNGAWQSLRG